MNADGTSSDKKTVKPTRSRSSGLVRDLSDDEDTPRLPSGAQSATPSPAEPVRKPHVVEFERYLHTVEHVRDGQSTIRWWGVSAMFPFFPISTVTYHTHMPQENAERYPVWASLARDYLAVMPTSVSSERAFSQGGITISDRRTRLKADVVEALQRTIEIVCAAVRMEKVIPAHQVRHKAKLKSDAFELLYGTLWVCSSSIYVYEG